MAGSPARTLAVLFASLALHAVILWWPRAEPQRVKAAASLEFDLVAVAPPAPTVVAKPTPREPLRARVLPPTPAVAGEARPSPLPVGETSNQTTQAPPSLSNDAPFALHEGAPGAPSSLLPTIPGTTGQALPGRTLHPSPGRDEAVAQAREQARVEGRIAQWVQGDLDGARARAGLVDAEVVALGHALVDRLNHSDGGSPLQLGVTDGNAGYKQAYAAARDQYGRTGDPGFPPPGEAPTLSEHLKELNAPLELRAAAQARETQLALRDFSPLFTVKLELVQAADGPLLSAELLTLSGNPKFDAFVLASAPAALTQSRPVEAPARTLRATWQVEGWLVKNDSLVNQAVDHLAFVGPVLDSVLTTGPQSSHFEYRAHVIASNR